MRISNIGWWCRWSKFKFQYTVKAVIFAVVLFSRTNYNPRKYTFCVELHYNLTTIREINNAHNLKQNQKRENNSFYSNLRENDYWCWINKKQNKTLLLWCCFLCECVYNQRDSISFDFIKIIICARPPSHQLVIAESTIIVLRENIANHCSPPPQKKSVPFTFNH